MKHIVFVLLCWISLASFAENIPVKVAVNIGPPWAYYDGQKVTGIDVEVIKQALSPYGYQLEFYLLGYERLIKEFNQGKFDFASPAAFEAPNGFFTDKYLPFEDVVISAKDSNLSVLQLDDLKGKIIVAYQGATMVLGQQYESVIKQANYQEKAMREIQLKLLANQKVDLVVGERRLLEYIVNKNHPEFAISIHRLFPIVSYGGVAKTQQLQQEFNQGLKRLKTSGEYQAILEKWQ
ncbi:substrate-binding periplasmic protein [Thalassotalea ganghwensis]